MSLSSTRPGAQAEVPARPVPIAVVRKPDTRNWNTAWRWLVVGLVAVAVSLFAWSYFMPWWQFKLFAPQYPAGLNLQISLTGLGGDAREINMLNHYIGMRSLDEAASVERKLAGFGVGLLGVAVVALGLLVGRRYNPSLLFAGLLFPAGFVADSFFWLWLFGHSMDPHAPLNIPAFTPSLFGGGHIGQFYTWAGPLLGFWLALGACGALLLAVLARRRVCTHCPLFQDCGKVCKPALVGPKPPVVGEAS